MGEIKEKFSKGLSFLVLAKNIKQADVARKIKISPQALNGYVKGRREGDEMTRKNICSAIGVSYEDVLSLGAWILAGQAGENWPGLPQPSQLETWQGGKPPVVFPVVPDAAPPDLTITRIPLISFVQAGLFCDSGSDIRLIEAEEWVNVTGVVGPNTFALRVSGKSMEPEFHDGEIVVVDPDRACNSGSFIIAGNGNNEVTLKQYFRDGDRDFLVPLNSDWGKPMDMTGRKWRIIGRVIKKIKDY